MFATALRTISVVVCLIVLASFAIFAVQQTEAASGHQQEELSGTPVGKAANGTPAPAGSSAHKGAVHDAIDEASNTITSPFSGIISGSDSQWAIHIVKLVLSLLVYGFGLGYLARMLRVRT